MCTTTSKHGRILRQLRWPCSDKREQWREEDKAALDDDELESTCEDDPSGIADAVQSDT